MRPLFLVNRVLRAPDSKKIMLDHPFTTAGSRKSCPWADVYYTQLRTRGKSHACALRCLSQRWLKILWKMWQTRTRYDAELHARNQLKHGSWVLKIQHP
jgi:hypothetical protein